MFFRATADEPERRSSRYNTRLYGLRFVFRCRVGRRSVTALCRTTFFPDHYVRLLYMRTDAGISDHNHAWTVSL